MAEATRIKLDGVAELKAALAELGEAVATKVGRKAARSAAVEFQGVVKETAPYRPGERTKASAEFGHLRDNIRVRKARSRTAHTLTYTVSTGNAYWGSFLEFGTVRMAAQPWLRPAFDVVAPRLVNVIIDGLKIGIEAEAKRAARIKRGREILANGRNT